MSPLCDVLVRTNAPPACPCSCPRFAGTIQLDKSSRDRFARVAMYSRRNVACADPDSASHHRAFHAGAVLGVVNALRCASTRPMAGPSGIDDASARHVLAITRWWLSVLDRARNEVDAESRRRMLTLSRRCRTALPPFAPRASGARFRSPPSGHDIERTSPSIAACARLPRAVRRCAHELRTADSLRGASSSGHGPSRGRRSPEALALPRSG